MAIYIRVCKDKGLFLNKQKKFKKRKPFWVISHFLRNFARKCRGCSVVVARKTSDLDSAYLQCAGAGSIPVTRSRKKN